MLFWNFPFSLSSQVSVKFHYGKEKIRFNLLNLHSATFLIYLRVFSVFRNAVNFVKL